MPGREAQHVAQAEMGELASFGVLSLACLCKLWGQQALGSGLVSCLRSMFMALIGKRQDLTPNLCANLCESVEGGDHERLLRMSHDQFDELMWAQPHGHFCEAATH